MLQSSRTIGLNDGGTVEVLVGVVEFEFAFFVDVLCSKATEALIN